MRISSLTRLSDHFTRYDIAVDGTHNFVAEGVVVHNTSANVRFRDGEVSFFSGGAKHAAFVAIFDTDALLTKFQEIGHTDIVIHGEAYGGKILKMSKTYGPDLRFVAFDVKVGDSWLSIDKAKDVVDKTGLEFVHFEMGTSDLAWLDAQRDADSVQAIRNGMGPGHIREGIVIRPVVEVRLNNGNRVCAKHKRKEFMETDTPREVDPAKQLEFNDAQAVAQEFVVQMRLEHVLDKMRAEKALLEDEFTIGDTGAVVRHMLADIRKEESDSITWSKAVDKAIGKAAAALYTNMLRNMLRKEES